MLSSAEAGALLAQTTLRVIRTLALGLRRAHHVNDYCRRAFNAPLLWVLGEWACLLNEHETRLIGSNPPWTKGRRLAAENC